jgi:tight adherence protein B
MALGGCGFCAALAGAAGGPVLGASAGVVVGVAGWLVARGVRRRAADRRAAQVLSAVRLLGAELAAGGNAAAALAAAAEAAPACAAGLHAASGAVARGDDPGPALEPFPDLAGVAAAWRVAEQAGAPLAAVLDRVGADLADRAAARRAVAVATAGARSSAALLAMLPLLGVALGASLGARPGGFLLGSPAGRLVLLIGVLLDAAGTLWTVRLVDSAERVR